MTFVNEKKIKMSSDITLNGASDDSWAPQDGSSAPPQKCHGNWTIKTRGDSNERETNIVQERRPFYAHEDVDDTLHQQKKKKKMVNQIVARF